MCVCLQEAGSSSKAGSKLEGPRLQAKVKPMSTSDERMMEEAISMANEFASHSERMQFQRQESVTSEHSDSGAESPRLISRIKASIKRSPKQERQRTFSESLHQDSTEEVPVEAQEAYNMLVVHGSVKENSRGYQPRSTVDNKRESLTSNGSAGQNFAFADSSSSSVSRTTPDRSSPARSLSRHSSERGSASPPIAPRGLKVNLSDRPSPAARPEISAPAIPKRGEPPMPKPRPEIVQRVEPTFRATPPPVPTKDFDKSDVSANRSTLQYDTSARNNAFEISAPLAVSEPEWKRSEESLKSSDRNSQNLSDSGRVDSLNTSMDSGQKSNSPSEVSQSSASKFSFFDDEADQPSPREIMSKLARESRLRRSLDHQRGVTTDSDLTPNRNLREPQGIPGKAFISPPANGDGEEEVDTNPLRMLRGGVIPVRGGRAGSGMSSNKPTLRHPKLHFTSGSSGSSGPAVASAQFQHSVSMDSSLRDPRGTEPDSQGVAVGLQRTAVDVSADDPPALPPRSFSICDSSSMNLGNHSNQHTGHCTGNRSIQSVSDSLSNPLPLPPRIQQRSASVTTAPRSRKYPLLVGSPQTNLQDSDSATHVTLTSLQPGAGVHTHKNHPDNHLLTTSKQSVTSLNRSVSDCQSRHYGGYNQNEDSKVSDMVLKELISKSERYKKPLPLPSSENPDVTLINFPSSDKVLISFSDENSQRQPLPDIVKHLVLSKEKYKKPFPLPNFTDKPKLSSSHSTRLRTPPPTPVDGFDIDSDHFFHEIDSSSLANLPHAPPPPSYNVAITMDASHDSDFDDNVFEPATPTMQSAKTVNLSSEGGASGSSTFPRGFKLFGIKNVKWNLEQLGFYNRQDPFWGEHVIGVSERTRSQQSEESVGSSPQMLSMYKCTEGVSYEDLLEFALDR